MTIRVKEYQFPKRESQSVKQESSSNVNTANCDGVKPVSSISSSLLRGAYGVVTFKGIENHQSRVSSNKVSFTANPLYNIKLRKLITTDLYEMVPAKFSQLLNNESDGWAILNVNDLWSRIDKTPYAGMIADNFINAKNPERAYFVVESGRKSKELFERITCLLETTNPKKANKDIFEIHFLQASPKFVDKTSPEIKGSGELSLYGAVKLAKENGFKKVQLLSSNDGFYDKMSFVKTGTLYPEDKTITDGGIYELPSAMFDSFLEKVEKKYNLK